MSNGSDRTTETESEQNYFTTDTESVASEIDVSELEENQAGSDFEWKRLLGYIFVLLIVIGGYVLADLWAGIGLPLVP